MAYNLKLKDRQWFYDLLGFLVIGVIALYFGIWGLRYVQGMRYCLKAGYPGVKVVWDLNCYCIKRVDQTDVVTPLRDLKK